MPSTQKAYTLENELARKFNQIINIVKKDFLLVTEEMRFIAPTIMPFKTELSQGTVVRYKRYELKPETREAIEPEVYAIIRSYYQKAYMLGANYAAVTLQTELFTTQTDTMKIKNASEVYTENFFFRLEKFVKHFEDNQNKALGKRFLEFYQSDIPETGPKSVNYGMTQLAEIIIWNAISLGTLEKASSISEDDYSNILVQNDINDRIKRRSTFNKRTEDTIYFRLITSRDDRVCKAECLPISKKMFTIYDYRSGLIKHTPIHHNCRCRYLIFRKVK